MLSVFHRGDDQTISLKKKVDFNPMTIDFNRVKAICFDVDGTLSDTDDQFVQKLIKIANHLRFILPGSDIHRIARKLVMLTEGPGNWVYSLADKIGLDNKIVAIGDRLYEMGIGKSAQPFQLIRGGREMLANLQNHYPLSIISARGQKSTFRFLFQFELLPYFRVVATGQTCNHTKPYPDPIEWAAARMGVPPTACLVVGDTVVDIISGKKAGAYTVGVLCGFGERKELERAGADLILDHTTDLMDLLLNNKNKIEISDLQ
jgi:phosphoglycolate phosphatase-like HAD superfamily hydrolase